MHALCFVFLNVFSDIGWSHLWKMFRIARKGGSRKRVSNSVCLVGSLPASMMSSFLSQHLPTHCVCMYLCTVVTEPGHR